MEENSIFQPKSYEEKDAWIQTFTGRVFPILNPTPEDIDARDIAHALSLQCRFTGHVREFYSVAEHCVRCAIHAPTELALQALLHDAQEAYISDISRPLKRSGMLDGYMVVEDRIWKAVALKFGVPEKLDPIVKKLDAQALITEQRDLLGTQARPWIDTAPPFPETIVPWSSRVAEERYLAMLEGLIGGN